MDTKRRIGTYICWRCHREFPLYDGQRRHYCDGCIPAVLKESGKRGGRPSKKAKQ